MTVMFLLFLYYKRKQRQKQPQPPDQISIPPDMRPLKNKQSCPLIRFLNLFSKQDTPKQHVFIIPLLIGENLSFITAIDLFLSFYVPIIDFAAYNHQVHLFNCNHYVSSNSSVISKILFNYSKSMDRKQAYAKADSDNKVILEIHSLL